MSKIKNGGLDQCSKLYSLNGVGAERVNVILHIGYVVCCAEVCDTSNVCLEETGMSSSVLDILSECLIGTNSWFTLPRAMHLARITISPFLDMYVTVLVIYLNRKYVTPTDLYILWRHANRIQILATILCLKKVPTFKLCVILSNFLPYLLNICRNLIF